MCEACLLATTPDISRTAHNGNAVYTANEDMPLTCYSDFGKSLTNPHRDEHIIARCVEAQEAVLHYAKLRRNKVRYKPCKVEAYKNQVSEGQYISWGFGDKCFDEYFGEVAPVQTRPKPTSSKPGTAAGGLSTVGDMQADHFVCPRILAIDPIEVFRNELEPHGLGIKFFADGSIYVGEFTHGKFNTEDRGVLSRPSGLNYEGTWMSGLKHGSGMQIYADHSVYTGEFANGFEHGEGRIQYADGAHFHGRFRFGRRDGPGQMTVGQEAVRRHYRDKENLLKEGMPVAQEADDVRSDIEEDRLNPPSLLDAATDAVALAMTKTRSAVSGPKIQARLSEFLKHKLVQTFFAHLANSGRPSAAAFEEIMSQRAFTMHKELAISYIRMKYVIF